MTETFNAITSIPIQGTDQMGTAHAVPISGPSHLSLRRMDRQTDSAMNGPSRFDRVMTIIIGLMLAAFFLMLFCGCAKTTDTREGQSQTVIEHHPLKDGGFVEKRTTYDSSQSVSKTESDVNWGGLVANGIGAAATGDWAALGGIAATAVAAGGAALIQRQRANEHKADASEGWAKYEAAMKDKSNG